MMKSVVLICIFFYGCILPANAQMVQGDSLISLDPQVRYGKLANGFTYYIRKNNDVNEKTAIRLVVKAGFAQEAPDQEHVAHVLEHVVAARTTSFPNIFETLGSHGLDGGTDFRASTGFEVTEYTVLIPSSDKTLLKKVLQITYERCGSALLNTITIENERNTVLNELGRPTGKARQSVNNLITDRRFQEMNITESVAAVKRFRPDALIRFYKTWYTPDRQAVVVVGNLDVDSVEAYIKRVFEGLPKVRNPKKWNSPQAVQAKAGQVITDFSGAGHDLSIEILNRTPGFRLWKKSDYRRLVASEIFNRMVETRLSKLRMTERAGDSYGALRYDRGLLFPDAGIDALYFSIHLHLPNADAEVDSTILDWLKVREQIVRFGFTESELLKAKREMRPSREMTGFEMAISYQRHFLGEQCAPSQDYLSSLLNSVIKNITLQDVAVEVKRWLGTLKPDIIIKGGAQFKSTGINGQGIRRLMDVSRQAKIASYMLDTTRAKPLMTEAEVEQVRGLHVYHTRKYIASLDAYVYRFTNGIELVVKNFKPFGVRSDKITMNGIRQGGVNAMSKTQYLKAVLASGIVYASGVGALAKADLDNFLGASSVEFYPYINGETVKFKGEAKLDDLEILLQVTKKYLEAPRVDPTVVSSKISEVQTRFASGISIYDSINAQYMFSLSPPPRFDEVVRGFSADDALRSYTSTFSKLNELTFVLTGDFDLEKIELLLIRYFGSIQVSSLETPQASHHTTSQDSKGNKGNDVYEVLSRQKEGTTRQAVLFFGASGTSPRSRIERSVLVTVLNNILYEKLRNQLGMVYSVDVEDKQVNETISRLLISFRMGYGGTDAILRVFWEEIERLKTQGPEKSVLDAAVTREAIYFENGRSHEFWQKYFTTQAEYGRDFSEMDTWKDELQKISASDIQQAAKRILDTASVVTVWDGGS